MPWTVRRLIAKRLVLRPFVDEDTVAVVAMLTDPQVRNYMGGPVDPPDGFSAGAIAEQWGAWCVAISDTGAAVGSCTFSRDRKSLELSYSLLPEAWGNGYAAEARIAVLEWVWANTDEPAVIAVTQTANQESMALPSRLRFTEDHRFEEYEVEQSMQSLRRPADWSADIGTTTDR
jgi:RimJ/RimL family protein N-acetyltransferase